MLNRALYLSLLVVSLSLSQLAHARLYNRDVNLITSNYDLVDTTYIDRGRLNGVKVGDRFEVKFRDGKVATQVVVTSVFERMASVKIVDRWLLKDGQTGNFDQRPMVVALERRQRRPAPDIQIGGGRKTGSVAKAGAAVTAPGPPAAPAMNLPGGDTSGLPPTDGGLPPAPGAPDAGLPPTDGGLPPGADAGLPPMDGGAPPAPDAGGLPPAPDAGLPPAPDAGLPPAPDAGLPPAPDAGGLPPAPDSGLPPAPDAGLPPAPDAGLPPAPDSGLPPAPDAGLPPAPDAGAPPGDPGLPPPL